MRLAKVITDVLSPAVLIVVLVIAAAWRGATTPAQAWIAGAVGVAAGSAIPIAYIAHGVRRGRWTDHHVREREQRRLPLAVALVSGTIGTIALAAAGAREVAAVGVAGMGSLAVAIAITMGLRWKVSIHAIVAATTSALLTAMFGPWLALTWPVAVLIGWSRVRLGDHTWGQVFAGGAIGAAVATALYLVVR